MMMKRLIAVLLVWAQVALPGVGWAANCGGATVCVCGDTVTSSYVLPADLSCTNAGASLIAGATGITVDLGGYTLSGDGVNTTYGVTDTAFDSVIVTNGFTDGYTLANVNFSNLHLHNRAIDITCNTGVECIRALLQDDFTVDGIIGDVTSYVLNADSNDLAQVITVGDITVIGGGGVYGAVLIKDYGTVNIDGDINIAGINAGTPGLEVFDANTSKPGVPALSITVTGDASSGDLLVLDDNDGALLTWDAVTVVNGGGSDGIYLNSNTFAAGSEINGIVSMANTAHGLNVSGGSNLSINNPVLGYNALSGAQISNTTMTIGNAMVEQNANDGVSLLGTSVLTIHHSNIKTSGGQDGIPTDEGDGLTGHQTSICYSSYNTINRNDNTALAFVDDSKIYSYNDTLGDNGLTGGPRGGVFLRDTADLVLSNDLVDGSLPYNIFISAGFTGTYTLDKNLYAPSAASFATTDGGTTIQADLAEWRTATSQDAQSMEADPLLDNTGLPAANSPAINAGAIIAGIHDQATPATDIAGTQVLTIPDIGAYEYPGGLYFSSASADGGNGTRALPYNAWTDYPWTGYNLRAEAEIYLQGAMIGTLDLSGLTDTGAKTVKGWPGKSGSVNGFVGGVNDVLDLSSRPPANVFTSPF